MKNNLTYTEKRILTIGELIEFLSQFSNDDFVEGAWEGISNEIRGYEYDLERNTLYLNVDQF